jgi:hypothetical protein
VSDKKEDRRNLSLELPNYLKISLIIVAFSFLAYSIYWAAYSMFWLYNLTVNITTVLQEMKIGTLQYGAIILQEYSASIGYFLELIGAVLAVQCTVMFIKNDKRYLDRLGKALFFGAFFFLLLITSSVHHLLGVALSWSNVDVYVGLSFLLQALLIAPPFLMLSHYLRKPQTRDLILKWVVIAAPAVVWGFWVKYLFLWLDTFSPLGPEQASLATIAGAANSCLTLLIAGIITSAACLHLYRKRRVYTRLVGVALILFGSYFIIYDIVSIWVHVYSSFLYLTDFWMTAFPILGIAALKMKPFKVTQTASTQPSKQQSSE